MEYIASVRDRETKEVLIIKKEYLTKKAFKSDLAGNGYSVRFIATKETFNDECCKYHERVDAQVRLNKLMWESDRKQAQRMGMSVKEYRSWLKNI